MFLGGVIACSQSLFEFFFLSCVLHLLHPSRNCADYFLLKNAKLVLMRLSLGVLAFRNQVVSGQGRSHWH